MGFPIAAACEMRQLPPASIGPLQWCRAQFHGDFAGDTYASIELAHDPRRGDERPTRAKGGMQVEKVLARNSRLLALSGLVAIAFGVVVLVWPGISAIALVALFGAFALVYGLLALGQGLNLLAERQTTWVPFVLGGLSGIAIGAVTFFRPGVTALVLVYFIAAWAIVTGIFALVAAVDWAGEVEGDWLTALGGLLSIAFGILVAIRPGSGALAILWLIGIYGIVLGVIQLVAAFRLHGVQDAFGRMLGGERAGRTVTS